MSGECGVLLNQSTKNARVLAVPDLTSNLLSGLSILGFAFGWLGGTTVSFFHSSIVYSEMMLLILLVVLCNLID